jgi:hypothetical protein
MIDNIRKSKFSFSRESPRLAKLDLFKNQLIIASGYLVPLISAEVVDSNAP